MSSYFKFPEPERKGKSKYPAQQPFPVPIASRSGVPARNSLWKWYEGTFIGQSVVIEDVESIKTLYSMGCFGKSNISDRAPKCMASKPLPAVVRQRQYDRQKTWKEEQGNDEEDSPEQSDSKVLVIADSDSDPEVNPSVEQLNPELRETMWDVDEELHLALEEAFFLSYGLGCLIVKTIQDKKLDILEMWKHYCEILPDFPYRYTVYHHFRSKGWVVRLGLKYGVHYLLYKESPAHYHSTYAVIVNTDANKAKLDSWRNMAGLQRMCTSVNKNILIATVLPPESFNEEDELLTPACIQRFEILETLVSRWAPSRHRESKSPEHSSLSS